MKFRFLFLGRTQSKYLAAGVADYLKRIRAYRPAEEVILKETKARDDQAAAVRSRDTARLLESVAPTDVFVVLDPGGRMMTSPELAEWLQERMDMGVKSIVFGLGGPQGLTNEALDRADLKLSLSRLTLTHEMSRLVLVEQIYRALRINAGHPYHK